MGVRFGKMTEAEGVLWEDLTPDHISCLYSDKMANAKEGTENVLGGTVRDEVMTVFSYYFNFSFFHILYIYNFPPE